MQNGYCCLLFDKTYHPSLDIGNYDRSLLGTSRCSTTIASDPLPIDYPLIAMIIKLIRIIEDEIEERSFVFHALGIMKDFDQEGEIMIGHFPSDRIVDQVHANHPGKVPVANILALRIRRPHPQPRRRHLAEKAKLAFEEELCETRSWGWRSVVVCKAKGVRVSVCGSEETVSGS